MHLFEISVRHRPDNADYDNHHHIYVIAVDAVDALNEANRHFRRQFGDIGRFVVYHFEMYGQERPMVFTDAVLEHIAREQAVLVPAGNRE